MEVNGKNQYLVGMATADITPPVGVPLGGFAVRGVHSSTGVFHPLRAVALTIDDGQTPILILSAEWLGFYDLTERVRTRLREVTGVPEEQIVLSGTHTHCGPAIRRSDIERFGWIDHDYIDRAIETMARISDRAMRHRFPARLRVGMGGCSLAMNRRRPDPERPGRIKPGLLPNPEGPTDHDLSVITIESLDNMIVRGVLFNYACHPTSRKGLWIGGDYVGFAYDYLEEAFSLAQPCFLQGCAGDQKPRPFDPSGESFGERTVEQTRQAGHELGEAVANVIKAEQMHTIEGPIAVNQAILDLETEPLDHDMVRDLLQNDSAPWHQREWAQYHQRRIDKKLPEERHVKFEIQTIRFGNSTVLITMAGEMTVEHGLRLKSDLHKQFNHVLPLGYTNSMAGYIPVKRQFPEFGYEVLDANQLHRRTGRFLEDTEARIHDHVRHMLSATAE